KASATPRIDPGLPVKPWRTSAPAVPPWCDQASAPAMRLAGSAVMAVSSRWHRGRTPLTGNHTGEPIARHRPFDARPGRGSLTRGSMQWSTWRTMTDDRRLTVQGQERKDQLLDHAATLFAERGYAETRVLDIVRAAGVAKGLFYWYFENKEALFRELVEQNRLRLRRAQAKAIDPTAEPLMRLRQGAEASMRFMAQFSHFFALLEV